MKILVEFDVPESWDYYTEEQNLHSLTNWGATNDGVAARIVKKGEITDKQHSEMREELLKEIES